MSSINDDTIVLKAHIVDEYRALKSFRVIDIFLLITQSPLLYAAFYAIYAILEA